MVTIRSITVGMRSHRPMSLSPFHKINHSRHHTMVITSKTFGDSQLTAGAIVAVQSSTSCLQRTANSLSLGKVCNPMESAIIIPAVVYQKFVFCFSCLFQRALPSATS
jgi:hypothetical protein